MNLESMSVEELNNTLEDRLHMIKSSNRNFIKRGAVGDIDNILFSAIYFRPHEVNAVQVLTHTHEKFESDALWEARAGWRNYLKKLHNLEDLGESFQFLYTSHLPFDTSQTHFSGVALEASIGFRNEYYSIKMILQNNTPTAITSRDFFLNIGDIDFIRLAQVDDSEFSPFRSHGHSFFGGDYHDDIIASDTTLEHYMQYLLFQRNRESIDIPKAEWGEQVLETIKNMDLSIWSSGSRINEGKLNGFAANSGEGQIEIYEFKDVELPNVFSNKVSEKLGAAAYAINLHKRNPQSNIFIYNDNEGILPLHKARQIEEQRRGPGNSIIKWVTYQKLVSNSPQHKFKLPEFELQLQDSEFYKGYVAFQNDLQKLFNIEKRDMGDLVHIAVKNKLNEIIADYFIEPHLSHYARIFSSNDDKLEREKEIIDFFNNSKIEINFGKDSLAILNCLSKEGEVSHMPGYLNFLLEEYGKKISGKSAIALEMLNVINNIKLKQSSYHVSEQGISDLHPESYFLKEDGSKVILCDEEKRLTSAGMERKRFWNEVFDILNPILQDEQKSYRDRVQEAYQILIDKHPDYIIDEFKINNGIDWCCNVEDVQKTPSGLNIEYSLHGSGILKFLNKQGTVSFDEKDSKEVFKSSSRIYVKADPDMPLRPQIKDLKIVAKLLQKYLEPINPREQHNYVTMYDFKVSDSSPYEK